MNISIDISGEKEVIAHLEHIKEGVGDLRKGAWTRVRQAFNRIEKRQFEGEGVGESGKWAPLTPRYAKVKQAKWGNLPINQASQRLFKSLTTRNADSVVEEKADELTLGTSVPYAGYVQKRRPVIDLTATDKEELLEPVVLLLRQLADNSRLRSLRG